MLADFRRWVLELSIGSSPSGPTLSNILIEAVAEIREALWDRYTFVASNRVNKVEVQEF